MPISEIIRIDKRFRIVIPKSIREAMGIVPEMFLLISSDENEIRIVPFADPDAKTINMTITMGDFPGSLAKIADTLANLKIDLLLGESRIMQRKKIAQWFVIAEISNCKKDLETIKRILIENGGAEDVEFSKKM
ncbi:MAG: hypothetical protein GF329_07300 [Candidatus Lokiarchaeota archaeon]|nr:hypothetical protein [Candidatus Lokiarchaeota archaeon]